MGSNDDTARVGLMAESRKCWNDSLQDFRLQGVGS